MTGHQGAFADPEMPEAFRTWAATAGARIRRRFIAICAAAGEGFDGAGFGERAAAAAVEIARATPMPREPLPDALARRLHVRAVSAAGLDPASPPARVEDMEAVARLALRVDLVRSLAGELEAVVSGAARMAAAGTRRNGAG